MPAHTPTYRTPAAPAATWRQRVARAMGRQPATARPTPSPLQIPVTRPSNDAFERMDLDQRVRQLGEW
jgi:hypothetical protein